MASHGEVEMNLQQTMWKNVLKLMTYHGLLDKVLIHPAQRDVH